MYFHDRKEAGRLLADSFTGSHRKKHMAVLAVSPGGVIVGREIARKLHTSMSLLLTEPVGMPGVAKTDTIGLIDQDGHFTYNKMMPTGLLTEILTEMRTYLENQKMQKLHKLTRAMSGEGFIEPDMFHNCHVIIVSDGFRNGLSFEAAKHYLKTIKTKKIIAAAPNVSVPAVDRLHIQADEMKILDVLEPYLDTDHYFEDNTVPDIQELKTLMGEKSASKNE